MVSRPALLHSTPALLWPKFPTHHCRTQAHAPLLERSLKSCRTSEYQSDLASIPLAVREAAFVEAADVFCALLSSTAVYERMLHVLAALWGVPVASVQQHANLAKPALQLGSADVSIGRATLPLLGSPARHAHHTVAAAATSGQVTAPRVLSSCLLPDIFHC